MRRADWKCLHSKEEQQRPSTQDEFHLISTPPPRLPKTALLTLLKDLCCSRAKVCLCLHRYRDCHTTSAAPISRHHAVTSSYKHTPSPQTNWVDLSETTLPTASLTASGSSSWGMVSFSAKTFQAVSLDIWPPEWRAQMRRSAGLPRLTRRCK